MIPASCFILTSILKSILLFCLFIVIRWFICEVFFSPGKFAESCASMLFIVDYSASLHICKKVLNILFYSFLKICECKFYPKGDFKFGLLPIMCTVLCVLFLKQLARFSLKFLSQLILSMQFRNKKKPYKTVKRLCYIFTFILYFLHQISTVQYYFVQNLMHWNRENSVANMVEKLHLLG